MPLLGIIIHMNFMAKNHRVSDAPLETFFAEIVYGFNFFLVNICQSVGLTRALPKGIQTRILSVLYSKHIILDIIVTYCDGMIYYQVLYLKIKFVTFIKCIEYETREYIAILPLSKLKQSPLISVNLLLFLLLIYIFFFKINLLVTQLVAIVYYDILFYQLQSY